MAQLTDSTLLAELLRRFEPRLRRAFFEIVAFLRARRSTAEVIALINAGRVLQALDVDDLSAAGKTLAERVNAVYLAAAREVAAMVSERLKVFVPVDLTNPRAVAAMRQVGARLVREVVEDQRAMIREVVAQGIARGMNPRAQARLFREAIGLTARQVRAVENYRRLLETADAEALERKLRDRRFDASVRAAVEGRRPLTKAQIDKMVAAYQRRYLKFRAETIARNEALAALHAGAEEGWRSAIDAGHVDPEELTRKWVTAGDGRVRHSHRAMSGQVRPFGEAFLTGNGYAIRYPHDPAAPASERLQCRCNAVVRYRSKASEQPAALAA